MSEVKEHIKAQLRKIPMKKQFTREDYDAAPEDGTRYSVSDGSPEGVKTGTGLIEDDSAVTEGQTPSPNPHPQGEVEKVIERLKQEAADWRVGPVVLEAADLLTTAQAENERLRGELERQRSGWAGCFQVAVGWQDEAERLRSEVTTAQAEIEKLRLQLKACQHDRDGADTARLTALSQAEEMRKALGVIKSAISRKPHSASKLAPVAYMELFGEIEAAANRIDTALSLMKGGE